MKNTQIKNEFEAETPESNNLVFNSLTIKEENENNLLLSKKKCREENQNEIELHIVHEQNYRKMLVRKILNYNEQGISIDGTYNSLSFVKDMIKSYKNYPNNYLNMIKPRISRSRKESNADEDELKDIIKRSQLLEEPALPKNYKKREGTLVDLLFSSLKSELTSADEWDLIKIKNEEDNETLIEEKRLNSQKKEMKNYINYNFYSKKFNSH